jgi:hypothetical protein
MAAQGDVWSVSGLLSDVIIAMYGRSPGDVHLQYARSKEVWREVSQLLHH